jgi:hypothetical protein
MENDARRRKVPFAPQTIYERSPTNAKIGDVDIDVKNWQSLDPIALAAMWVCGLQSAIAIYEGHSNPMPAPLRYLLRTVGTDLMPGVAALSELGHLWFPYALLPRVQDVCTVVAKQKRLEMNKNRYWNARVIEEAATHGIEVDSKWIDVFPKAHQSNLSSRW